MNLAAHPYDRLLLFSYTDTGTKFIMTDSLLFLDKFFKSWKISGQLAVYHMSRTSNFLYSDNFSCK